MEELGREDEFSEEPSKRKKTLKTLASPLAWTCKRNCCFRNTIHSTHTVTSLRSTVFKGEQRFLRWLTSLNRSIREKQKKKFWNQLAWHSIDPLLPFWFTCAVNVTLRGWLKLVSISTLDCTQLKLLRLKDRHQLQRFALVCSFVLRHHVQKHVSVGLLVHSLQHR